MNELTTEIKTHCVLTYSGRDYYITQKQYDAVMEASGSGLKGISLNNDYINFSDIKVINQITLRDMASRLFGEVTKINRPKAIRAVLSGFDRAIKEMYGTYEKATEGTRELRKKMAMRVKELENN